MQLIRTDRLLLACFFVACIAACSGEPGKILIQPAYEMPENFYKRFDGTINGKKVVFHLNKTGGDLKGVYYSDGSWLNLLTDTLIGKDSVVFFEDPFADYYWDKKNKPRIALKWLGKGFTGKWISGSKDTVLRVTLTENYPAGAERFELLNYQDSAKAFPQRKGSPEALYEMIFPKPGNVWLNLEFKKLNEFLEINGPWEKGLKRSAADYFKSYMKNAKDEIYYNADSTTGSLDQYSRTTGLIKFNDKNFLVIDQFKDTYGGGAHGYYYSTMACYDLQNKKRMKLSDILTADSLTLRGFIEQEFRKQYQLKPHQKLEDVLFEKHLPPNQNFYFNSNGLAFIYNPYEVASYAQGQIMVFIPFQSLLKYLRPEFAKRMAIAGK